MTVCGVRVEANRPQELLTDCIGLRRIEVTVDISRHSPSYLCAGRLLLCPLCFRHSHFFRFWMSKRRRVSASLPLVG
jgi:hypothetical protein